MRRKATGNTIGNKQQSAPEKGDEHKRQTSPAKQTKG